MFLIKEYKKVESLEEAWELNQKKTNRILGGMLWMKMGKASFGTAIDLSGLGLDRIEETKSEFRIGCMTTLRDLEQHPGLHQATNGAMKEALSHIVGVQFRNVATVGGSIFGRYGFSDVLTMFLAMDSYVELYEAGVMPLTEFIDRKVDKDVLVRVIVKKEEADFFYQSVRNQAKTDFPVLTCAAAKTKDGTYRFAIGARPMRAMLLLDEKKILDTQEDRAEKFAAYAKEVIPTGTNGRGSAQYRSHLVEVLVKRAVKALDMQNRGGM